MKVRFSVVLLGAACATFGGPNDEELMKPKPKVAKKAPSLPEPTAQLQVAVARLEPDASPSVGGEARFWTDQGVVTMDLSLARVPMGRHAIHLHDRCGGEDWNPMQSPQHGRFDMPPFHLGDVGNVFVGENGVATMTFATELWSVGTGMSNDVVGRAVVIHERNDDFSGQPQGNSGSPIACGIIELSSPQPQTPQAKR